jgi:hypothetical protein
LFSCSYILIFRLIQRVAGVVVATWTFALLAPKDADASDARRVIGVVDPTAFVAAGVDGGP